MLGYRYEFTYKYRKRSPGSDSCISLSSAELPKGGVAPGGIATFEIRVGHSNLPDATNNFATGVQNIAARPRRPVPVS